MKEKKGKGKKLREEKEKEAEEGKPKKEETAEKEIVNEKKAAEKHGQQVKIVVVIMAVLLASIFVVYWIVQESKTFEYNSMKFYKEKEGSIIFYKSLLGFVSYSGESVPFVLKLRTDPRELEKIEVEGKIKNLQKETTLSLSPEIANCANTVRTMVDFSMTLGAFGIKTKAATIDKGYSEEHNTPLIDCKDAKRKSVIVMKEGNESKIVKTGDCYTIEIQNCEIQESFEKFILDFIANSMTNV